eukprot:4373905-Pyramimonas_sp.AAC.1
MPLITHAPASSARKKTRPNWFSPFSFCVWNSSAAFRENLCWKSIGEKGRGGGVAFPESQESASARGSKNWSVAASTNTT